MDLQEQRMECLRMALELGGKPDSIISAAEQLLDFVTGNPQPGSKAGVEPAHVATPAAAPERQAVLEAAAEAVVPDAIAACGTVLVMPEGGDLADAIPTAEVSSAAVEAPSQPEAGAGEVLGAPIEDEGSAAALPLTEPVVPVVEEQTAPGVDVAGHPQASQEEPAPADAAPQSEAVV